MGIRKPATAIRLHMRTVWQERDIIHTYKCDGNPLPSFEGEPKLVAMPDDIDAFADLLWSSLNRE